MLAPMYCQFCGAANSDDAKFCNQCGARIARAGELGGPSGDPSGAPSAVIAPGVAVSGTVSQDLSGRVGGAPSAGSAAPVNVWEQQSTTGAGGGPSMMDVSLEAIGVKSSKKVWAGIIAMAVALVVLGALGSWLLRGAPEVVTEAGHAQPEDPFVIGTPLPPGAGETPVAPAEPESDSVGVTSGEAVRMEAAGASMRATGSRPNTAGGATMGSSAATSAGASSESRRSTGVATSGGTTSTSGGTTSAMATGGAAGGVGAVTAAGGAGVAGGAGAAEPDAPGGAATGDTTPSSAGGSGGSAAGATPALGGDLPEERDLELELYGSRVRFVVRRYYAARAQGCFDRATRNNPNVSGTVVVNMTIGAEGNVSGTSIVRNTTGDDVLGNCLRSQVASWQLPPPPGGSLEMQMPFSR